MIWEPNEQEAWTSPEMLQNVELTEQTDYWCCGILAFRLLTGKETYNDGD